MYMIEDLNMFISLCPRELSWDHEFCCWRHKPASPNMGPLTVTTLQDAGVFRASQGATGWTSKLGGVLMRVRVVRPRERWM